MSLYLTIFDGDNEINGWTLGHYSDFGCFRETISRNLNSRDYPTLMEHSDCDGEWPVKDLPNLRNELQQIGERFKNLPVEAPKGAFEHTAEFRRNARSLYDCYHNVDGENIFEAFIALCDEAIRCNKPILLQ